MSNTKVCLFTAHSPQTGGGGVIIRSLVLNLPEISFSWFYVGDNPVSGYEDGYLGKALMGGALLTDIWQTWTMLHNKRLTYIDELVKYLVQVDYDSYWIISHNEGLRLALELSIKQQRPVHLTIHDDWAGALCARSVRYRYMQDAANKLSIRTLKAVSSFDVISAGMKNYYKYLSGRDGGICHRYLPEHSILKKKNKIGEEGKIIAGHIGSIYDKADFIDFLTVFNEYAIDMRMKPVLKMWGSHLTIRDIPAKLKECIVFYPTLAEDEIIPELALCDFVYAMYPLSRQLSVFSATSLPTKLTSYLQAGRPIFGHGPADSTLAEFLTSSNLGLIWTGKDKEIGRNIFKKILTLKNTSKQLEDTRNRYFGELNLTTMKNYLIDLL